MLLYKLTPVVFSKDWTTVAPEDPSLRGFAGKVWLTAQIAQSLDQKVSRSILCEGEMGKAPEVDEAACTPQPAPYCNP